MEEDCPVRPARHKRRGSGQHEPTRASGSPRNLSFDELRKKRERFLPAQIASLWWNGLGYPFLDYVHLSTAGHLLQRYRRLHFSGEVRVVEFVRVANAFMWHQFKIFSAEGVAVACGEVREGHPVGAADFGIYVVNLAREAVRWKPFGHCVCIEECSIDFLGRRTEHSVKPDSVGHQTSPFDPPHAFAAQDYVAARAMRQSWLGPCIERSELKTCQHHLVTPIASEALRKSGQPESRRFDEILFMVPRRECLDHVVVIGERHLLGICRST